MSRSPRPERATEPTTAMARPRSPASIFPDAAGSFPAATSDQAKLFGSAKLKGANVGPLLAALGLGGSGVAVGPVDGGADVTLRGDQWTVSRFAGSVAGVRASGSLTYSPTAPARGRGRPGTFRGYRGARRGEGGARDRRRAVARSPAGRRAPQPRAGRAIPSEARHALVGRQIRPSAGDPAADADRSDHRRARPRRWARGAAFRGSARA